MGNTQSHGRPHAGNRLAKPKTNTNAPSFAPGSGSNVDPSVSISSRYAQLSLSDRQQIKSQLLSPVRTEFSVPWSSDGEESPEDYASSLQWRPPSRANSLSCFSGGKTGSTPRLASLPASKLSLPLVQSSQPVDLETAIAILQEVQKKASPEDVAALEQVLQPYVANPSPRPTSSCTEQTLSRRTSALNSSTSSLTRRRSLAITPGVATRTSPSPVESQRRAWNSWRTPQLDPQEEAKWRRHGSPLARVAAVSPTEEGRESPTPRAHTPGDMEYSHLGSLKLGSLRIANGEPSPAASAKLNWHRAQTASQEEDYFSSDAQDGPIMMKTRVRRHTRSKSALQPETPPLYRNLRVSDDGRKAKTTSRYFAPPKPPCPKRLRDDAMELDMEPEPVRRLRVMNKSQDTIATTLDVQYEVANDASEPIPSVTAEDIDEGFVSEDATSMRNEVVRIFDGTMFGEPATVERLSTDSTDTTLEMRQESDKRPHPKKADSGYSSGGSFKTKQRGSWKPDTTQTVSEKSPRATDFRQGEKESEKNGSARYSFEQERVSAPKSYPPSAHARHSSRSSQEIFNPALHPATPNSEDGTSDLVVPKTPKAQPSSAPQYSVDRKSSVAKRLQRKHSSKQELPVVQSYDTIPERSIPGIPKDVRKQFARRLSKTPGMDHLTQTYSSRHHISGEDPELELTTLPPVEFPTPTATPEPDNQLESESEPRGRHHKRTAPERPTSAFGGLRRSLSLFGRKSKAEKEEKPPPVPEKPTILDLGTSAASLGRSPYDVAMKTAHINKVSSPTHPHQLGDSMPRTKSMINMDSQTAAKFARLRSKDRSLARPEMPSRPKSFYGGGAAANTTDLYRRHSYYGKNAPPMPTVPSNRDLSTEKRRAEQRTPPSQHDDIQPHPEAKSGPTFRARSKGRGRVVTPLIEKFDQFTQDPSAGYFAVEHSTATTTTTSGIEREGRRERETPRRLHSFTRRRKFVHVDHPDWN